MRPSVKLRRQGIHQDQVEPQVPCSLPHLQNLERHSTRTLRARPSLEQHGVNCSIVHRDQHSNEVEVMIHCQFRNKVVKLLQAVPPYIILVDSATAGPTLAWSHLLRPS